MRLVPSELLLKDEVKMRQTEVLRYLLDLDHYPTWTEAVLHWGGHRVKEVDRALSRMKQSGKIILDEDMILVTAITNAKLQRLVDESILIRGLLQPRRMCKRVRWVNF